MQTGVGYLLCGSYLAQLACKDSGVKGIPIYSPNVLGRLQMHRWNGPKEDEAAFQLNHLHVLIALHLVYYVSLSKYNVDEPHTSGIFMRVLKYKSSNRITLGSTARLL